MRNLFEARASVLENESATKRLNAEIELTRSKCDLQEIENIRRWAFAAEDQPETEWQKGYDAARAMVRTLLPALPTDPPSRA